MCKQSNFGAEVVHDPDPQALEHPGLRALYDYWGSRRGGLVLPGRQHIDPLDFRSVISLVNLMDVDRSGEPLRVRYRLVGEAQTRNVGQELTGLYLEEAVVPELLARVQANMSKAVATRQPVFDSFPIPHPDRHFIVAQRMYFPLAADGETVDMLLVLHGYDAAQAKATG